MRNNPNLTRRDHLLTFEDHTQEDVLKLLRLCRLLKDAHRQGVQLPLLKGKVLSMMFFESSLRTRVSFETAMAQLGGHAEFLQPKPCMLAAVTSPYAILPRFSAACVTPYLSAPRITPS